MRIRRFHSENLNLFGKLGNANAKISLEIKTTTIMAISDFSCIKYRNVVKCMAYCSHLNFRGRDGARTVACLRAAASGNRI